MDILTYYFHTQHMFVASTLIMVWICAKATKDIFIKARKDFQGHIVNYMYSDRLFTGYSW